MGETFINPDELFPPQRMPKKPEPGPDLSKDIHQRWAEGGKEIFKDRVHKNLMKASGIEEKLKDSYDKTHAAMQIAGIEVPRHSDEPPLEFFMDDPPRKPEAGKRPDMRTPQTYPAVPKRRRPPAPEQPEARA